MTKDFGDFRGETFAFAGFHRVDSDAGETDGGSEGRIKVAGGMIFQIWER